MSERAEQVSYTLNLLQGQSTKEDTTLTWSQLKKSNVSVLCSQAGDGMKQSHGMQQEKKKKEKKTWSGHACIVVRCSWGKPSVVNCDFALVLSISCLGSFTLSGRL